ncbi:SpoIID/LytB domain-containing protein [Thermosediminibacter oceani]|uniref:SpoIID/LytB domain protein n=1 Tax=Thermosediminibacter oceani (strain ATCC BAA-1034 / DSM 16646 / JW/IW-1228P) TaxID=555079 RepID=D9RXQ9_THEOJ|nr:SpoIID/LytB domain-containing protein [Thermosediminibacter oceani]ADL08133.1 SpoIID/LytB domain protein [Thermosediminibacter oceani DSM 16646]
MRKLLLPLLAFLMIVTSVSYDRVRAETKLPSTIRVGLFYDKTAGTSYMLASSSGFVVGIKKHESFIPLYSVLDKKLNVKIVNGQPGPVPAPSVMNGLKMTGKFLEFKGDSASQGFVLPLPAESPLYVASAGENGIISLNGRNYRGKIEFLPASNGGITAVNELGLEEYLYGVLPNEMPPSWPMEALKAQAVASRTYAVHNILKKRYVWFDVTGSLNDQVYGGYDSENARTNEAVNQTKGQVLVYQDEPILALYHSNSGGITEDCSEVFGGELPYLKSVKDEFSLQSPNSTWTVKIPRIQAGGFGTIYDLAIIEKSQSGRVKKMLVRGSSGDRVLSANDVRTAFQLKSNLFEIKTDAMVYITGDGKEKKPLFQLEGRTIVSGGDKAVIYAGGAVHIAGSDGSRKVPVTFQHYEFQGRGYGHGVGMSQWGAKVMAERGYNYRDILLYYYKNVDLAADF